MTRQKGRIGLRVTAAASAALMSLAMMTPPEQSGVLARGLSNLRPAADECDGDACAQVSVTFDESRQQYRAQNNSADRWARVTASNMAASASACLAPGKEGHLPLKSIAGSYHAEYAEARCGEEAASGPPGGE
jgi:hypothetical protein